MGVKLFYSVDYSSISLEAFCDMIASAELIPSRKRLKERIRPVLCYFATEKGDRTLADLRKRLKNKKEHPALAEAIGIDEDYLALLLREINSYEKKPLALEALDFFSPQELSNLAALGLKKTSDYYFFCLERGTESLAKEAGLASDRGERGFWLSDLLRVNGIGPVYAHILIDMGIRTPKDFLERPPEELVRVYSEANARHHYTKTNLSLSDIEYVRRFASVLG